MTMKLFSTRDLQFLTCLFTSYIRPVCATPRQCGHLTAWKSVRKGSVSNVDLQNALEA